MSFRKLERQYHCWDDCQMSGCPGHTAVLEFQSVTDWFGFKDGKGGELSFHPVEMEVLLDMLKELAEYRVEAQRIFERIKR